MPTMQPGKTHTVYGGATKPCRHGQIVTEDGFVGVAFKTMQVDRFTRPEDAAKIAADEVFDIHINDGIEAPLNGPLASADVGTKVYIDPATNTLATAKAAGLLPVGLVDSVDESRAVPVALIYTKAWQAFAA